jgi:hypothetical protein
MPNIAGLGADGDVVDPPFDEEDAASTFENIESHWPDSNKLKAGTDGWVDLQRMRRA